MYNEKISGVTLMVYNTSSAQDTVIENSSDYDSKSII